MPNRHIVIAAGLTLFYAIPLLLGTSYYNDDIFRSVWSYYGWQGDGRPLAEAIYRTITTGDVLPDYFPGMTILALILYSAVSLKVCEYFIGCKGIKAIVLSLCFLASPFFVSNLLFRYDSFFMVLSVTMAITPYILHTNKISSFVLSVTALVASLSLYQAAIALFICLSAIEIFMGAYVKKENYKNITKVLIIRALTFLLGTIAYLKVIIPITNVSYYFLNFNKIVPLTYSGLETVLNNYKNSYILILKLLDSPFLYPIAIMCAAFVVAVCVMCFRSTKPLFTFLTIVIVLCALVTFIPGVGVYGQNPSIIPRTIIGISAASFFCLYALCCSFKRKWLWLAPAVFFYFTNYLFLCASTNAVREDFRYAESLATRIVSNLDRLNLSKHKEFIIDGRPQHSGVMESTINIYPFMNNMMLDTFSWGYDGGRFILMRNGLNDITYANNDKRDEILLKANDKTTLYAGNVFAIYLVDNIVVIRF